MERTSSRSAPEGFGAWLLSQIKARGMNQTEFAAKVGVKHPTVSRWVSGRRPEAELIERIADVLVLDYDFVATKAGYRPRELTLEVDPESPEGQLVPLIRKMRWTDERLEQFKAELEFWINFDAKRPSGT